MERPPAEDRRAELDWAAGSIAASFGLPLIIVETGTGRLERALGELIGAAA